jgi:hypothetical protein
VLSAPAAKRATTPAAGRGLAHLSLPYTSFIHGRQRRESLGN